MVGKSSRERNLIKLKFKVAERVDLREILKIKKEAHQEFVRQRPDVYQEGETLYTEAYLNRFFDKKGYYILIASQNEEVVAYAFLQIVEINLPMMKHRSYLYIHDLAVVEQFQGLGIGAELMGEIERQARSFKLNKIELAVHLFSEDAIRLYEKICFKTRTLRMEKDLT